MTRGAGRQSRRWAVGTVVAAMLALTLPPAALADDAVPTPTSSGATGQPSAAATPSQTPTPEAATTPSQASSDVPAPTPPETPSTAPHPAPAASPTPQPAPATSPTTRAKTAPAPRAATPLDIPDDPNLPPSVVAVQKTVTQDTVEPGDSFSYQLTPSCSGITAGCVGMTVTDVVPEPLVVDEAALEAQSSPPDYTITYDPATRTVTIVYGRALTNPDGTTGWPAGTVAPQISIPVAVPPDTTVPSGTVVTNTATTDASNAPPDQASADVTINVPRVVNPTVTKDWADGSAVAGSAEASTITLNVKNQSSNSAEVNELVVSDDTPETFENFNFAGATVTAFPAGADTAMLTVTLADGSTAEATVSAPAPATFTLPAGTDTRQVVGYEIVFTNSNGDPLPYDATGGTVEVGMRCATRCALRACRCGRPTG